MTSIHEKEHALLNKWCAKSKEEKDGDNLAPDGLLYRGELHYPKGEMNYWAKERGSEEEKWHNAPKRLLIVTKDLNTKEDDIITEAWDIRAETGLDNNRDSIDYNTCITFYRRLRMWTYGLLRMKDDGSYPSYDEACNMNNSGPFYIEAPIARINCKKQCGTSSISEPELRSYLEKYKDLLVENLKIYDEADIILCCSGTGTIKDFIRNYYLTDLIGIPTPDETNDDYWIYYSPSTKKVVINSWHPSARISPEESYNCMMQSYSYFIKNKK